MTIKKVILITIFVAIFSYFFSISPAKAASVEELQQRINQLLEELASLQRQIEEQQGKEVAWCYDFSANLFFGSKGDEVAALQMALEKEGFSISDSEQKGSAAAIFGESTASATVGFQEKYKSEILSPWGFAHGTGYVGKTTRSKLNKLYGCGADQDSSAKVILPNGGEVLQMGSTYNITWQCSSQQTNSAFDIYISENNNAASLIMIGSVVSCSAEKYTWIVGNKSKYDYSGRTISPASNYKIELRNIAGSASLIDTSDAFFAIAATNTSSIAVVYPNGGESYVVGTGYLYVKYNVSNIPIGTKATAYLKDSTGKTTRTSWENVENEGANVLSMNMELAASESPGQYKIEVCAIVNGTNVCDVSDSYFNIVSATSQSNVGVSSPGQGEVWQMGSSYTIRWFADKFKTDENVNIILIDSRAGDSYYVIAKNVAAHNFSGAGTPMGSYVWAIPKTGIIPGTTNAFKIYVGKYNPSGQDGDWEPLKSSAESGVYGYGNAFSISEQSAAPIINRITPFSLSQGETKTVTLYGYNLSGISTTSGSCGLNTNALGGFILGNCNPQSLFVSMTISVSNEAIPGERELTITTPNGTSNSVKLTILNSTSSCHTENLWGWNYCSGSCQCSAGEGDCDYNSDCVTGYCAQDVGAKYGQVSSMDVCEAKEEVVEKTITISSPKSGEAWQEGGGEAIIWRTNNFTEELKKDSMVYISLEAYDELKNQINPTSDYCYGCPIAKNSIYRLAQTSLIGGNATELTSSAFTWPWSIPNGLHSHFDKTPSFYRIKVETQAYPSSVNTYNAISDFFVIKAGTEVGSLSVLQDSYEREAVVNESDFNFSKIKFTAGNAEDVKIESIKLYFKDYMSEHADTYSSIGNIRLYDENAQVGSTKVSLTNGLNGDYASFSGLNFVVPAGSTRTLNLNADVLGTDNAGMYILLNGSDIAATGVFSGEAITVSGSTTSPVTKIYDRGELSISLNSSSPQGETVIGTNTELLRVDFLADREDILVKSLKMCAYDLSYASLSSSYISALKLYDVSNLSQPVAISYFGATNYGCVSFAFAPADYLRVTEVIARTFVLKGDLSAQTNIPSFRFNLQGGDVGAVGAISGKTIITKGIVNGGWLSFSSPIECIDSDGGKNYYTKGTVTEGTNSYTDYCSELTLKEYFCLGTSAVGLGGAAEENYTCSYGCQSGACLSAPASSIKIISPNGGESLIEGNTYTIRWESSGVKNVNIEYGNGKSYYIISSYPASSGEYSWTPEGIVDQYQQFVDATITQTSLKIGVFDADNGSVFDKSDNYFTLSKKVSVSACDELLDGVLSHYLTNCSSLNYDPVFDLNKDKIINSVDYSMIVGNMQNEAWCVEKKNSTENLCSEDKKVSPCGQYGDITADGYVTTDDVTDCEKCIVGLIGGNICNFCDVDGSGSVNVLDITKIENYIAGNISTFEACDLGINSLEKKLASVSAAIAGILREVRNFLSR